MTTNRSRSRTKKRKRKLDAELSFIDVIGDVFGKPDEDLAQELAEAVNENHTDVSKDSIVGQEEFMKKQSEIDKKSK